MTSSGIELRIGNKYRVGRKIGSGSFGDIYLGTRSFYIIQRGELVFFFFFCVFLVENECKFASLSATKKMYFSARWMRPDANRFYALWIVYKVNKILTNTSIAQERTYKRTRKLGLSWYGFSVKFAFPLFRSSVRWPFRQIFFFLSLAGRRALVLRARLSDPIRDWFLSRSRREIVDYVFFRADSSSSSVVLLFIHEHPKTGIMQKPTSATFTLRIKTVQNLARRHRHPERSMVRRRRRI